MQPITVGVLRGGEGSLYAESLSTGHHVLAHTPQAKYTTRDIFVDTKGVWYVRGLPLPPLRALAGVDVVWNALHNTPQREGSPYHALQAHATPYTGSDRFASALAGDPLGAQKHLSKSLLRHVPRHVLRREECTEEVINALFHAVLGPVVVRGARAPYHEASIIHDVADLAHTILFAFETSEQVVLEPFIEGRILSVFVVEGFRGETLYALPPIELVPELEKMMLLEREADMQKKYPASITQDSADTLIGYARTIHKELALRDYSRSDFIMRPDGTYLLQVHAHPQLGEKASIHIALEAVGATFAQFVDHVLERRVGRV